MLASGGFLLTIMVSLLLAAFDTAAIRVRSTEHWYGCIRKQLLIQSFIVAARKVLQTLPQQDVVQIQTPSWVPATAIIHFDATPVILEIRFHDLADMVLLSLQ